VVSRKKPSYAASAGKPKRADYVDLERVDEDAVDEALREHGRVPEGELADKVDTLEAIIDALVDPIARLRIMRCADCHGRVDRDLDRCPLCGESDRESLFKLSDVGNANRLAFHGQRKLRYCAGLGGWQTYDGKRWSRDERGRIEHFAKQVVEKLYAELGRVDHDLRRELLKHIARSESARGILAMIRLAQSDPTFAATADQFDADPWLLNCTNGTLDLRSLVLRPHRPEDMLTKVAGAPYDQDASSETWNRALQAWMGGDNDLVAFLRRALGYSIAGVTSEEKLFVVLGPGGGGKSTCIEAVRAAIGDYSRTADFEAFLRKQGSGGIRNDIARLAGARFVSSIEVEDGAQLAESLVKSITGGDRITARFLYQEAIEFTPQLTLWLVANDAPRVNDRDSGMWRRIVRIPFEHAVPKERRDPKVKATLVDPERSGAAILAWLVRGCTEWQTGGLQIPAAIERATDDYRDSQDPLSDFFEDECAFGPELAVDRNVLRRRYEDWAKRAGHKFPIAPKTFNERLRVRSGIEDRKSGARRFWEGVGLQPSADSIIGIVRVNTPEYRTAARPLRTT
jgi:putative DNA primase/helicase